MKPSCAVTKLMLAARPPAGVLVQVGRAGDPAGELPEGRRLAAPEVPHGVAVLPVPLRPQWREVAHLVAARPDVPRLGDQLDLGDRRVLLDQVEEGAQPVHVVELAGQRGGEVEAEAVDVHLQHPVAQRVHDQLQGVRVPHVQRVAGAGVVHVVLRLAVHDPVVRAVVDAAHGQRRAEVVALGGVVVDDVEDHLDAGLVQVADHRLELLHLLPGRAGGGVGRVRREEADGVVAPVVAQPALAQRVVVDELVHRHQLDRGHPERAQVVDHRRVRHAGVRAAHLQRDRPVQEGQALDVRLVDDRLVVRAVRRPVGAPVEVRVHHHGLGQVRGRVLVVAVVRVVEVVGEQRRVPVDLAVDRLRVRVEQQLGRVAAQARAGVVRARAPGSRSAGRDRRRAGSRARRSRPPRAAGSGSPAPVSSNRHSSTRSATSEKSEKLVPIPSYVAPSGYADPGHTCIPPSPRPGHRASRECRP